MKKRRIALLLALALVPGLFACSSAPAAQSPAREAAPTESSAASPAQAAPEPAAPAGEPAEEAAAETPAETETPEPAEEAPWQRAYRALLEDPALLDTVIEGGEYRKGYFGGWETPWERLPFSSYAAADLNGDGTPELLLRSREMGLTDLIGWNGEYVYLGYDDYMGFLPEEKAALVHGHWHGAGGSYDQEYSVVSLEEPGKILSYFDRLGEEEAPVWSFQDPDGGWSSGSEKEDRERYESLYAQYVPVCIPMEEIPFYPLDDPQGLRAPCDLGSLPDWRELQDASTACIRNFLLESGWESAGAEVGQEPVAMLWDLDWDGLLELLLTEENWEETAVFRYDAREGRMALLGSVKGALALYWGDTLVGRDPEAGAWFSLRLNDGELRAEEASWVTEEYLSPPLWWKPALLAESLTD